MSLLRALLPAALVLLGLGLARGEVVFEELTGTRHHETRPEGGVNALAYTGDGKVQLKLCECERALGQPSGLSCQKQGWFLSSFERQGQWVAGGGFVPLSHAICCRPCLPSELPPDPSGQVRPGEQPLGVVSIGRHASTDELPVRCEGAGRSFATGFSQAVRVFTASDTFYPVNTITCATPALLLESGDAWELERCDCHDASDGKYPVNCGGLDTHELLFGYIFYRTSPLGHIVPVGPAQCCRVCLSSTFHPMDQCDDRGQCTGHGVCNLGACECFDGWAGADCSKWAGGGRGGRGHGVPPWAITLIVLSSCALAGVLMLAAGHIARLLQEGGEGGSEEGDERQPLLIRIDPDDAGSVGSQDTECEEGDVEEVEERVNSVLARLERAAPGTTGHHAHHTAGAAAERAEGSGAQHGPATPSAQASPRAGAAAAALQGGSGSSAAAVSAAVLAAAGGEQLGARAGAVGRSASATSLASLASNLSSHPIHALEEEAGSPSQAGSATAAAAAPADAGGPPPGTPDAAPSGSTAAAARGAAGAGEIAAAAADGLAPVDRPSAAAAGLQPQEAPEPPAQLSSEARGKEQEEEELVAALRESRREVDPLATVDCIVCMSRPVQTVLIPCGHICVCRRCSRKLNRCPCCRRDIARRQRLFI